MDILADENCDALIVLKLRETGHDVLHILDQGPGTPDESILRTATANKRILLTGDLGFGLLAERFDRYPPAIVLMRLHPLGPTHRADVVARFFESLGANWRGKFFVLEPGLVRERLMGRTAVKD